ncbi:MAG: hypothetical protein ACT4OP_08865 [Actinomycetota bacterium]
MADRTGEPAPMHQPTTPDETTAGRQQAIEAAVEWLSGQALRWLTTEKRWRWLRSRGCPLSPLPRRDARAQTGPTL